MFQQRGISSSRWNCLLGPGKNEGDYLVRLVDRIWNGPDFHAPNRNGALTPQQLSNYNAAQSWGIEKGEYYNIS